MKLLYGIGYDEFNFFIGLRGLAETQGGQRGEWGSSFCGSQWKSGPDKIQEHQGKMTKATL